MASVITGEELQKLFTNAKVTSLKLQLVSFEVVISLEGGADLVIEHTYDLKEGVLVTPEGISIGVEPKETDPNA